MSRTAAATAARLAKHREGREMTPLERARVAKGWSQRQLAAESGVHAGTILNIEGGASANTRTLERLAEVLGVRPAVLAGWE